MIKILWLVLSRKTQKHNERETTLKEDAKLALITFIKSLLHAFV